MSELNDVNMFGKQLIQMVQQVPPQQQIQPQIQPQSQTFMMVPEHGQPYVSFASQRTGLPYMSYSPYNFDNMEYVPYKDSHTSSYYTPSIPNIQVTRMSVPEHGQPYASVTGTSKTATTDVQERG